MAISYFTERIGVWNAEPVRSFDLEQIIRKQNNNKVKEIVFKIRAEKDKEKRAELKSTLPYFTPYGEFSQRNNRSLIKLSGYFLLDFDLKDNKGLTIDNLKERINENPFIYAYFLSPSGGLKIFVKTDAKNYENEIRKDIERRFNLYDIAIKEGFSEKEAKRKMGKDEVFYPKLYKAFHSYFNAEFDCNFDLAQGRLSQPCFLSYDPNYHINENSDTFLLRDAIDFYKKKLETEKAKQVKTVRKNTQKISTNDAENDFLANKSIHFYNVCLDIINNSSKGNLHKSRIEAAYLAGGYVYNQWFDESAILPNLISAARSKSSDPEKAEKEVINSFRNGNCSNNLDTKEIALQKRNEFVEKKGYSIDNKVNNTNKVTNVNTEKRKLAIKNIYKFAHEKNNSGTYIEESEYVFLSEENKISKKEVIKICNNVFEKNKDAFGIAEKPVIFQVELFIKKNLKTRFELVKNRPEQKMKTKTTEIFLNKELKKYETKIVTKEDWEVFDVDTLSVNLQKAGIKYNLSNINSLAKSDTFERIDHFKESFENLEYYDKEAEKDYFKELCSHVKLQIEHKYDENPTNVKIGNEAKEMRIYFENMLKKHLLRMIKTVFTHEENRYCFSFVGAQDKGKTRFFRYLNFLGLNYMTEKRIDKIDKDLLLAITQNFIYIFDDIDKLEKKQQSALKSFISMSSVNERAAYEKHSITYKRRCGFFGTLNDPDFLIDDENTRWLILDVYDFNWQEYTKIDIQNIWRQLFYEYLDKEDSVLTKEEKEFQKELNLSFQQQNSEEDLILKNLENNENTNTIKTVTEISVYLDAFTGSSIRLSNAVLGKKLVKFGYKPKGREGYFVTFKNNAENNFNLQPPLTQEDATLEEFWDGIN